MRLKSGLGYEVSPVEVEALIASAGRPIMVHQFLPGCSKCHAPHPLARSPKVYTGLCPDCGAPAGAAGPMIAVPAALTGLSGAIANACHRIADWLEALSKRI